MNLQPPRCTARTSLHGWWALTSPSHPYLVWGGCFLLHYSAFAGGFLLGSGVLYAARTFLLCLATTATDRLAVYFARYSVACQICCKVNSFFQYDPYIYPVGAYLSREYCLFLQFLTILFVIFWLLSTLYMCSGFICCAGPWCVICQYSLLVARRFYAFFVLSCILWCMLRITVLPAYRVFVVIFRNVHFCGMCFVQKCIQGPAFIFNL